MGGREPARRAGHQLRQAGGPVRQVPAQGRVHYGQGRQIELVDARRDPPGARRCGRPEEFAIPHVREREVQMRNMVLRISLILTLALTTAVARGQSPSSQSELVYP